MRDDDILEQRTVEYAKEIARAKQIHEDALRNAPRLQATYTNTTSYGSGGTDKAIGALGGALALPIIFLLISLFFSGDQAEDDIVEEPFNFAERNQYQREVVIFVKSLKSRTTLQNIKRPKVKRPVAPESFERLAKQDPSIIIEYAREYRLGWGFPQSYKKSFELYMRAANNGDPKGYIGIGDAYYKGLGRHEDLQKAHDWWQKAADAGEPHGYARAAYAHQRGYGTPIGTPIDTQTAAYWYNKAVETGTHLGEFGIKYKIYAHKKKRDIFVAVLEAAKRENSYAIGRLAWMFQKGYYVEQDHIVAFELNAWLALNWSGLDDLIQHLNGSYAIAGYFKHETDAVKINPTLGDTWSRYASSIQASTGLEKVKKPGGWSFPYRVSSDVDIPSTHREGFNQLAKDLLLRDRWWKTKMQALNAALGNDIDNLRSIDEAINNNSNLLILFERRAKIVEGIKQIQDIIQRETDSRHKRTQFTAKNNPKALNIQALPLPPPRPTISFEETQAYEDTPELLGVY